MYKTWICFVFMWTLGAATWTEQCNNCQCLWYNGRRKADCSGRGLSVIPKDLSPEIRDINFSNNALYDLNPETMLTTELRNINKLSFQSCSLYTVHHTAFQGLQLLIELDLSSNFITSLDKRTFRDNLINLRLLSISHNNLMRLDENLFYNLKHLQKISLDHNQISYIDKNAFGLLPNLQHIDVGYNRLQTIQDDFTLNLGKLSRLNLEGNPWVCDCNLQDFRSKVTKTNLISVPTECAEPWQLEGELWTSTKVFICSFELNVTLNNSTQIETVGSNVTFTCRVSGDEKPDVEWVKNDSVLRNNSNQGFKTSKGKYKEYTWNNLTITNVDYLDEGDYRCVAKTLKENFGFYEKTISLVVTPISGGWFPYILNGDMFVLITTLTCGVIVVLAAMLLIVCCCGRKPRGSTNKPDSNLDASHDTIFSFGLPSTEETLSRIQNDMEIFNTYPSGGDGESCPMDIEMYTARKIECYSQPGYRRGHQLLPDVLPSFPTSSSASTAPDTTQLLAHDGPKTLLSSFKFDQSDLQKTRSCSRSQLPFVNNQIPKGYVTSPIMRQSCSRKSTKSSEVNRVPLYDNLGLRTRVDGISIWSFSTPEAQSTPNSIPMLSTSTKTTTSHEPIATCSNPIAEDDSPPNNVHPSLATLSQSRTDNWIRAHVEEFCSLPDPNQYNGCYSKVKKIPPVPPPKPKKRTEPKCQDESKDGTEICK